MKHIRMLTIFFVLLLGTSLVHSAENAPEIDSSRIPVKITSEKMVYDEKGGTVVFTKDVIAEHGELTLWADKLTAYLTDKNKSAGGESIDRIVAEGNVHAKKGTTEGSSGKLTYVIATEFLKMEKNPKLKDGVNSLSGRIINYYARENRSEVIGGKGQRVRAIFLTPGGAN